VEFSGDQDDDGVPSLPQTGNILVFCAPCPRNRPGMS
jgi:hypothetical protein